MRRIPIESMALPLNDRARLGNSYLAGPMTNDEIPNDEIPNDEIPNDEIPNDEIPNDEWNEEFTGRKNSTRVLMRRYDSRRGTSTGRHDF